MKEIRVGDTAYTVRVLPPWVQAYLQRYAALARQMPESDKEAGELEAKMRAIENRIFAFVTPQPSEQDAGEVFIEICRHTSEQVAEAQRTATLFRKEPSGEEGG